jgi:hypothetical protein
VSYRLPWCSFHQTTLSCKPEVVDRHFSYCCCVSIYATNFPEAPFQLKWLNINCKKFLPVHPLHRCLPISHLLFQEKNHIAWFIFKGILLTLLFSVLHLYSALIHNVTVSWVVFYTVLNIYFIHTNSSSDFLILSFVLHMFLFYEYEGCPISKVPEVTEIERSLQCQM